MVDEKLENYKRYGWKTSEKNLETLPPSAPQAAKDLAKWLTLDGRKKSLVEWLGCVRDDGRIHGKFWPIGAWSGRMSHTSPNQANIFSPFHGDPRTPVEEVKAKYDYTLRDLWTVEEGNWLVGTDAEGIQLRILAHYMKSPEYVKAIVEGSKEDETDIHNVNKRALGPICRSRDDAKTFIYAFLLGASIPKVAEILKCNNKQAGEAVTNFLRALPCLKKLKDHKIPVDASRGFFIGLDGRKVVCDSEHLMLAGYLQNGEAVIMKHANVLWRKELRKTGIQFKQVDFVHDEWQTEVIGTKEEAEEVGRIQRWAIEQTGKDLGLFCPLAGSSDIGKSWSQTH
jgi:DNA polymerase-1